MIENYYYSIPRWKKIAFAMCAVLLLFLFATTKVKSGFFSWIATEVTDNITNEIFDALNQTCGEVMGGILDGVSNIFTAPWGPQLDTFVNNTNFAGASAADLLEGFGIFVGMFFSTLIWGFSMFTYFFSGKITDSKDTPISLTVRYGVAIAISYKCKVIVDTIINLIDIIHTTYVSHALSTAMGSSSNIFTLLGEMIDGLIVRLLSSIVSSVLPGVGFVIIVIEIIAIWKVLKGFFKLYAEMVSRYIVTVVLLLLFSAFGGTIVSNNTSQIFKSYLRTLFSSFIVMLFNIIWFKACLLTGVGTMTDMSVLQYIFLLELLHFGVKFDGILRSMGLGVATGGARIASAVGGAGRNLANALRNANDMRKSGGNLLKQGGAALAAGGNAKGMGMFKAGSALGAGANDILKGKGDPANSAFNLCSTLGAQGMKVNDNMISGQQAAGIMQKAMCNPADKDAQNAMKALSNNKLKEGAQAIMGSGYKVNDASYVEKFGADGQRHSGVKVNATPTGGADSVGGGGGKSFTGTLAGEGMFSDGNFESLGASPDGGDAMAMQVGNSMSKGETMAADDFKNFGSSEAVGALDRAEGIDMEGGSVESMGKNRDGEDAFRCLDADNNVQGTINGDEFIANSAMSQDNDGNRMCDSMLSDIQDRITADDGLGYSECTDFKPVQGQEGVYCAVATDSDGNTKLFTATDKGVYTNSGINDDVDSFRYDNYDSNGNVNQLDVNATPYEEKNYSRGYEASNQSYGSGESGAAVVGASISSDNDISSGYSSSSDSPSISEPSYEPSESSQGFEPVSSGMDYEPSYSSPSHDFASSTIDNGPSYSSSGYDSPSIDSGFESAPSNPGYDPSPSYNHGSSSSGYEHSANNVAYDTRDSYESYSSHSTNVSHDSPSISSGYQMNSSDSYRTSTFGEEQQVNDESRERMHGNASSGRITPHQKKRRKDK